MKRTRIAFLLIILIATLLMLVACDKRANERSVNITFMVDGSEYTVKEVSEAGFSLPKAPEKEGYHFDGWYLDADLKAPFKAFKDVPHGKNAVTVYAGYSRKLYQFRFFTSDTAFINRAVADIADLDFPSDPQLKGYNFTGWFLNKETQLDRESLSELCPQPATYDIYAKYECAHATLGKETLKEPSCEYGGERYAMCATCGIKVVLEILPPAGHKTVVDEEVKPTCLKSGKTKGSHCSVCHEVFEVQQELDALGHDYDGGMVTKPATCTEVGTALFKCKREGCEAQYVETIPCHTEIEWRVTATADCTHAGVRVKVCKLCGEELQREDIPASGHDLSIVDFDDSSHWQKCLNCGENFSGKHEMNGADCCDGCPFYIPDTAATGSVLTEIAKRDPISWDFKNVAGSSDGTLKVVVIDIAQGDSIFIRFPNGQTMLMDSGSVNFPLGNHYGRVKKVLNDNGVKQLDYLFVTHSDYDHVRYVDDVLDDFEIKNIYLPKLPDDSNGSTWEKVIAAIANERYTAVDGTKRNALIRYNIGEFEISGDGWRMRCYSYLSSDYPTVTGSSAFSPTAPDADRDEIINSLSPVCLLEYAGRTIVLTGDSNKFNEKYLVDRGVFDGLDADVLKVAHHGSKTSTTDEFLAAVKCEYAIISYGTNVFGHPTDDVLGRLNAHGVKRIFKTKESGNITVSVEGNGHMTIVGNKTGDSGVSDNLPVKMMQDRRDIAYLRKRKRFSNAA